MSISKEVTEKICENIVSDIDYFSWQLKRNAGNYSVSRLMKESRDIDTRIDWCYDMDLIGSDEFGELKTKMQKVIGECFALLYNK